MRRLSRSHTYDQSTMLGSDLREITATHDAQPPRSQSQAPVAVCVSGHWLGESPPMPWLDDRLAPFYWADAISEARDVPGEWSR